MMLELCGRNLQHSLFTQNLVYGMRMMKCAPVLSTCHKTNSIVNDTHHTVFHWPLLAQTLRQDSAAQRSSQQVEMMLDFCQTMADHICSSSCSCNIFQLIKAKLPLPPNLRFALHLSKAQHQWSPQQASHAHVHHLWLPIKLKCKYVTSFHSLYMTDPTPYIILPHQSTKRTMQGSRCQNKDLKFHPIYIVMPYDTDPHTHNNQIQ